MSGQALYQISFQATTHIIQLALGLGWSWLPLHLRSRVIRSDRIRFGPLVDLTFPELLGATHHPWVVDVTVQVVFQFQGQ